MLLDDDVLEMVKVGDFSIITPTTPGLVTEMKVTTVDDGKYFFQVDILTENIPKFSKRLGNFFCPVIGMCIYTPETFLSEDNDVLIDMYNLGNIKMLKSARGKLGLRRLKKLRPLIRVPEEIIDITIECE